MVEDIIADPYVIYTEDGHKQIRNPKFVYMIYKNATDILRDLTFKHKAVNDYNQHLCGGWHLYKHTKFEEVDRVAAGLKPVGISYTTSLLEAETKKHELLNQGIFATVYDSPSNDLYYITASPYGTLQEYFSDLDILAGDYEKRRMKYCARLIHKYKNVNFSEFHDCKFDDHDTCITGLILGYPIENSMALILRDMNGDDYFDFEEYNKEALDEEYRKEFPNREYEESSDEDCSSEEGKVSSPITVDPESKERLYTVYPYDGELGLYRDIHNFIVRQVSPGLISVIGKYDKETNSIIPLLGWEICMAKSYGLIYDYNLIIDDMRANKTQVCKGDDAKTRRRLYSVCTHDETLGLYRDVNNFITRQVSPGVVNVIGRYNRETNSIISLLPEDIVKAESNGLIYNQNSALDVNLESIQQE